MKYKPLLIISIIVLAILAVPAIAMQFTTGVNWSTGDFVLMALLLFSTALLLYFIRRKSSSPSRRIIYSVLAIALFGIIWIELAVGIF